MESGSEPVEVATGGYQVSEDRPLYTKDVFSCVAVGYYHPETGESGLLHAKDPSGLKELFDEMMGHADSQLSDCHVILAGGSRDPDANGLGRKNRSAARQKVEEYGYGSFRQETGGDVVRDVQVGSEFGFEVEARPSGVRNQGLGMTDMQNDRARMR